MDSKTVEVSASSSTALDIPDNVIDRSLETFWESLEEDQDAIITFDFVTPAVIKFLTIQWDLVHYPTKYSIEISDDREIWSTALILIDRNGGQDSHEFTGLETMYLRINCQEKNNGSYKIFDVKIFYQEIEDVEDPGIDFVTISLGGLSTATSSPNEARFAVDKHLNTSWVADPTHSIANYTIDLLLIYPVAKLHMIWGNTSSFKYKIIASKDGSSWNE
eukprot:Awhi_evm1s3781